MEPYSSANQRVLGELAAERTYLVPHLTLEAAVLKGIILSGEAGKEVLLYMILCRCDSVAGALQVGVPLGKRTADENLLRHHSAFGRVTWRFPGHLNNQIVLGTLFAL